jgi:hypothetical protein
MVEFLLNAGQLLDKIAYCMQYRISKVIDFDFNLFF